MLDPYMFMSSFSSFTDMTPSYFYEHLENIPKERLSDFIFCANIIEFITGQNNDKYFDKYKQYDSILSQNVLYKLMEKWIVNDQFCFFSSCIDYIHFERVLYQMQNKHYMMLFKRSTPNIDKLLAYDTTLSDDEIFECSLFINYNLMICDHPIYTPYNMLYDKIDSRIVHIINFVIHKYYYKYLPIQQLSDNECENQIITLYSQGRFNFFLQNESYVNPEAYVKTITNIPYVCKYVINMTFTQLTYMPLYSQIMSFKRIYENQRDDDLIIICLVVNKLLYYSNRHDELEYRRLLCFNARLQYYRKYDARKYTQFDLIVYTAKNMEGIFPYYRNVDQNKRFVIEKKASLVDEFRKNLSKFY